MYLKLGHFLLLSSRGKAVTWKGRIGEEKAIIRERMGTVH